MQRGSLCQNSDTLHSPNRILHHDLQNNINHNIKMASQILLEPTREGDDQCTGSETAQVPTEPMDAPEVLQAGRINVRTHPFISKQGLLNLKGVDYMLALQQARS
jgi:hypothetical protein